MTTAHSPRNQMRSLLIQTQTAPETNTVFVQQFDAKRGEVITRYTFPSGDGNELTLRQNILGAKVATAAQNDASFLALKGEFQDARASSGPQCSRSIPASNNQTKDTEVYAFGPDRADAANKVPMLRNHTGSQAPAKCVVTPTGI